MKYQRGSFIVVPSREKLRGMPVPAQALYMWLCSYANEEGECFPSRGRLAKDCDCSLNTIDRFTQLLIARGLLKVEHRIKNGEKQTNLYSVVIWEGGSPTDEQPSPTDKQGVVQNLRIELNPVLTQPTYIPAAELREVLEGKEEKPKSRPKYPHALEVFSWFPNRQKSWESMKNIQEREYAEFLWERGEDKVKRALKYHESHKDDENYGYKVVKPSDLERKWNDIAEYARKN